MLHVVMGSRGAYCVRVSKLLGCALSVLLCPAAGYGQYGEDSQYQKDI